MSWTISVFYCIGIQRLWYFHTYCFNQPFCLHRYYVLLPHSIEFGFIYVSHIGPYYSTTPQSKYQWILIMITCMFLITCIFLNMLEDYLWLSWRAESEYKSHVFFFCLSFFLSFFFKSCMFCKHFDWRYFPICSIVWVQCAWPVDSRTMWILRKQAWWILLLYHFIYI